MCVNSLMVFTFLHLNFLYYIFVFCLFCKPLNFIQFFKMNRHHHHTTTTTTNNNKLLQTRSKMFGRAWLPMYSKSRKPCVITSAVLSPFRSSSALVATVVPIRIQSSWLVSSGSFAGRGVPVSYVQEKLKLNGGRGKLQTVIQQTKSKKNKTKK